jgi:16S rRNA (uracil1498-N3)-methyltransferase
VGHVPHLLVEGEWIGDRLELGREQRGHLDRVLRVRDGEPITYTDGRGRIGEGRYETGSLVRGEERPMPRPSELTVAAPAPDNRDRLRFMVEKLSELGVAELRFLRTSHGEGRPLRFDRLRSWAVSGLEQSRGAWLMRIEAVPIGLSQLGEDIVVCDRGGSTDTPLARTVVIGPEGGWAAGEVPDSVPTWDLGSTVLRVETAAIVAASRLI